MDTKLPSGIRTRWFLCLLGCACSLAGPFTRHAQAAGASFSQTADSPLAVGRRPTTPVIADLNGDGRADIVVALEDDHAIAVLLGRPQGGFQPASGSPFPAGNSPTSIAIAELDGDAILDVVAVNGWDNSLTVLRGDGRGGFRRFENPIPTGVSPRIVRIGDVDGDSRNDLLVENISSGSISVLMGQGDGSFVPSPDSPINTGMVRGLSVADFNGDGRADFVTTSLQSEFQMSIYLSQGAGRFSATTIPNEHGSPIEFVAGDLDRDGQVDLVTLTQTNINGASFG